MFNQRHKQREQGKRGVGCVCGGGGGEQRAEKEMRNARRDKGGGGKMKQHVSTNKSNTHNIRL